MSIHQRIKQRREELGLSMQALADLVGVSAWQTIQQWEKENGTAPKRERLAAVAQALQTTPETLLFGQAEDGQKRKGGDGRAISKAIGTDREVVSAEAFEIARAFDQLKRPTQKAAIRAQLVAFGVLGSNNKAH